MLVALGFFTAGLIGFLLAPFYGRRTARIAMDKLRATMPLTSAEIVADKDRLRARYALTIHKLEQKLEKGAYAAARQRVELNRRDAGISELEGEVERLRGTLEEHENARRVLEQTIAERMPKLEQRLNEAKKAPVPAGSRDRKPFAVVRPPEAGAGRSDPDQYAAARRYSSPQRDSCRARRTQPRDAGRPALRW